MCVCGTPSSYDDCPTGFFCWSFDNRCRSFGRCDIHNTETTGDICQCSAGIAVESGCDADEYCIDDYVCSNTACNSKYFYMLKQRWCYLFLKILSPFKNFCLEE